MPKVVELLCPRCGATLVPEANSSLVRCKYCEAVSGIERTRVQPAQPVVPGANAWPQGPAGSHGGPSYPQAGMPVAARRPWLMVAFYAVPVLLMVAITYTVNKMGAADTGLTASTVSDSGIAILAQDLRAVDPADLIRQAAREARRRQPSATQSYGFFYHLSHGVLDSTGTTPNILLTFTYRATDPTKPPGQDIQAAGFDVRVHDGKFYVSDTIQSNRPDPVWPEPACSFAGVWRAAVQSGVPENAVVDVYYQEAHSAKHHGQMVWNLSVSGHNEFDRDIDAAACKIADK